MLTVVLKLFDGQGTRQTDGWTCQYCILWATCILLVHVDEFMSLFKPIITFFLTPKTIFYEFTNSFHAKYKPNAGLDGRTN